MRTVSRLRLLCFASSTGLPQSYGFYIAELSTLLLFAQSILCQAHHKDFISFFASFIRSSHLRLNNTQQPHDKTLNFLPLSFALAPAVP
jgi:hypothetical protein